jgi:hypothetical protein
VRARISFKQNVRERGEGNGDEQCEGREKGESGKKVDVYDIKIVVPGGALRAWSERFGPAQHFRSGV